MMKLRIELDDALEESEIVIRCRQTDDEILWLQKQIIQLKDSLLRVTLYKDGKVFYLPPEAVLFFETEQEIVYAHTSNDSFRVRHRLYELEGLLPGTFQRVSKSSIVNMSRILSLTQSFTAGSEIQFADTHKRIYVSRRYSALLRDKLTALYT